MRILTIKHITLISFLLVASLLNAQHTSKLSADQRGSGSTFSLNSVPLANEILGNDEIVGKDSSVLFQQVIDQTRDSIWHTVNDYSEISALSVRNGRRILDNSTGIEYLTQADTVQYFETDEQYIITLASGNYAVADLSTKRDFTTKQDLQRLVHFCHFKDGDKIEINGEKFEVTYFPKIYHRLLATSAAQDTVVDGFFVDTLQTYIPHKNLVYYSEEVHNGSSNFPNGTEAPYIFLNSNAGVIPQNVTDAPDGTMTAERLYGFNSTASNQLQIYGNKLPVQIGDTLTFSMWYRGIETTGGTEGVYSGAMFGTSFSGSPNMAFTLDGIWRRIEKTIVAASIPGTNSIFFGVFNQFANADTLDVWGFQIEKGASATDYQKSSWQYSTYTDRLYLYRTDLLKGNVLDLSNIKNGGYTNNGARQGNHAPFIQSAIDYCNEGERCNTVILPLDDFYCKSPIYAKRGVKLVGSNSAARTYSSNEPPENTQTKLTFALTDKTEYALNAVLYGSHTILDNTGFSNLIIVAADTISGYLKTEETSNSIYSYLTSQILTTGTYTGAIDSCALRVEVEPSSDNHYNTFDHIYLEGGANTPYGLYYEGGVGNSFNDCSFAADTSIYVAGGDFHANHISVETGNTGIYTVDGYSFINGFYSEGSAYNGGSTVKMNGGSLYFYNSSFQTNAATDTLFNLISGKNFSIQNSRIIVEGRNYLSDDFDGIDFINVGTVTELRQYLNLTDKQKSIVRIRGNYDVFDNDVAVYSETLGKAKANNILVRNSRLENSIISDTIKTSGVVLIGGEENLTDRSDSIPTFTGTYHKVISNIVTDTLGSATADMVVMIATGPSEFTQDKVVVEAYEIGEPYTISMWLKGISSATPVTQVAARLGTGGPSVNFVIKTNAWRRYEKTVYATVSNTNFNLRVNDPTNLDTFAIAGVQINKGYHATSNVPTTTVGVLADGNPSFTIVSGDTLELIGDVKLDGAIIDTTGSSGISGQVPVSTGTGWEWGDNEPSGDPTLERVSEVSDNATKSIYNMTSTVPVEFESSDNNTIMIFDETNERVTIGGSSQESTNAPLYVRGSAFPQLVLKNDSGTGSVPGGLTLLNGNNAQSTFFFTQNNYTPINNQKAAQIVLQTNGAGGITLNSANASSTIDFVTNTFASTGSSILAMRILATGFVGIGTSSADRLFHVEVSDAVTNAVTFSNRRTHITSGTAAAGFGNGLEVELENASGTNRVAATEEITYSDATNATEDATYTLRLMRAGTLTAAQTTLSTGETTFAGDVTVPDEAYGSSWNGSLEVPTKNAIYDKIEATKSHVELYNDKVSSIVQTVVANTPEQLHTLINGLTNGFTESNDTITYTGTTTKIFHLTCSFAWSNNTAPSVNFLYIYVNDVEVGNFYAEQAFTNANDFHEGATSGLLSLATGDQVTVYIESDTSSDIEVKHMNISLTEL